MNDLQIAAVARYKYAKKEFEAAYRRRANSPSGNPDQHIRAVRHWAAQVDSAQYELGVLGLDQTVVDREYAAEQSEVEP
jgi:hypothetical protein